jgi:gliding motility-associated-like protein
VACLPQGTLPQISYDLRGLDFNKDTLFVLANDSICFSVSVFDSAQNDTVTLFPISRAFGLGGSFPPPFAELTYVGVNPVQGMVCWKPNCELAGHTVPLIIGGRDIADCHGTNQVFDTVWAKILPIKQVDAGRDTSICTHGGVAQLYGTHATRFRWSPTDGLNSGTLPNPTASPPVSQMYHLTGWDSLGCPTRDSVWVSLIPPLQTYILGPDSLCIGQEAKLSSASEENILWINGVTASEISFVPDRTSRYWALPFDKLGCRGDTAWHQLFVAENLPQGIFSPLPKEGFAPLEVVFLNQSRFSTRYVWDFGDRTTSAQFQPKHTFSKSGIYTVRLWADNNIGCADSGAISFVEVWKPSLFLPNAFSPNGDGINDVFSLTGGGIKTIDFHIFNRWGQRIFNSTNPGFRWNGKTTQGESVPEGVYTYHIMVYPWEGEPWLQTGSITLIR